MDPAADSYTRRVGGFCRSFRAGQSLIFSQGSATLNPPGGLRSIAHGRNASPARIATGGVAGGRSDAGGHSVAGIHCKGVIETFIPGCNSDRLLQNLILDASENAFILPSRAIRQYRSTHVSSRQTWVDELSRFESVSVGWKSELAIGVLTTRADGWCRYCTKSLEKTTSKVQSSATLNFFSSRGSLSR
jgi:hypothetical protein